MKTVFRILKKEKQQLVLLAMLFVGSIFVNAQNDSNFDKFLAAGIEDAGQFATDYFSPATKGLMHSMNANWFNSGKVKPLGAFEASVLLSASLVSDENRTFSMNENNYNNVKFVEGGSIQDVATLLGQNDPDIVVEITYDDPIFGEQTEQINLPDGIGEKESKVVPTAYFQAAVGLIKHTELKARFVPKIKTDDASVSLYGIGLQHEITEWLPADKIIPVAISVLVAYTHLDGEYDFTSSSGIDGENQRVDNNSNTWLYQLVASTKLPIINVYGGIGYLTGKSRTDLLGTYRVRSGLLTSEEIVDPISISNKISSVRGTLGARLKLGFFRLNAEYNLSEFNTVSVGVNLGFR